MTAVDDLLEGCGIGFDVDPIDDADIPWVVLFASVIDMHHPDTSTAAFRHDARQLADEWAELFR